MKRRTFISCLIAGTAAAVTWLFVRRETPQDAPLIDEVQQQLIADSVIAHFPYLQLDRDGVLEFAQDHLEHFGPMRPQQERQIAMTYLLSADFFANNADESRLIHYEAYNAPYVGVCSNPFATFVEV